MEVIIEKNAESASQRAARIIARLMRTKPNAVLGLATGSTPLVLYEELVRMHREEELDFSSVWTFNLDEYIGLPEESSFSYRQFMDENLFSRVNLIAENTHIPDGNAGDVPRECARYEQAILDAGGIDIQVLGIGTDGHIGFNEPSSSFASRTRIKTLAKQTIKDNARFFGGDESLVPSHCITMGIGTIMDAGTILLLAFGEGKAVAVAKAVEGPVSAMVPASILQHHRSVKIIVDEPAASLLKLRDYYEWVYQGKPDWQEDL